MLNNNIESISLEEMLSRGLSNYNIIDVRSENEFAEDHIPCSKNIPILNNNERAAVGTVYKQEGAKKAKMLAVELLSPKLPDFIKKINAEAIANKNLVITCWRGGMRSGAAVTLLALAGIRSRRLTGGYAAFRRHVHAFFENLPENIRYITVFGPTGCAKTHILERLSEKGYPVINLEKHACHKGSSFGEVGEAGYPHVTQKSFETGVWYDHYISGDKTLFFIEGESPKIGKVTIPKKLYLRMRSGIKVLADAPLDFRIDFTINAYEPEKYPDDIKISLKRIEKYIGKAKTAELTDMLNGGRLKEFTAFMLKSYYDPMYRNAFPKDMTHKIKYSSEEEGEEMLKEIYNLSNVPICNEAEEKEIADILANLGDDDKKIIKR